jgi:hypothetical protein
VATDLRLAAVGVGVGVEQGGQDLRQVIGVAAPLAGTGIESRVVLANPAGISLAADCDPL